MASSASMSNCGSAICILEPHGINLLPTTDDDLRYLRGRSRILKRGVPGTADHDGLNQLDVCIEEEAQRVALE